MFSSTTTTDYYDDCNDFDNDSFQSALCEMEIYNDVLFHAIIPEEEEFVFSCSKVRGQSEDTIPSTHGKRERFLTANRESYLSLRSAAPSMGSSFMLSVGDIQSSGNDDDDLSYMTDPDVEERRVTVKFEETDGREVQIECLKIPWSESDDFEENIISVNFDETSEGAEKYNTHQKSLRRNSRCEKDTCTRGKITRSTTAATLECSSEVSSLNESFSSMSCGSSC